MTRGDRDYAPSSSCSSDRCLSLCVLQLIISSSETMYSRLSTELDIGWFQALSAKIAVDSGGRQAGSNNSPVGLQA